MRTMYGFDLDGTLVRSFTAEPLPGRRELLAELQRQRFRTFLATNQAGPVWRIVTGDPQYPTIEQVAVNITSVILPDCLNWQPDLVLVCTHPGRAGDELFEIARNVDLVLHDLLYPIFGARCRVSARVDWRKPQPGMLLYARKKHRRPPMLYVGDIESDAQAAAATPGCEFAWAEEFFGRGTMTI